MQHKQPKFSGILVVAVLMVLVLFFVSLSPLLAASGNKDTTYSEIYYYFENQQVTSFRLDLGTGSLEMWLKEGKAALPESNAATTMPSGGLLSMGSTDNDTLPANGGTVYMTYKLPYGGDFNTGRSPTLWMNTTLQIRMPLWCLTMWPPRPACPGWRSSSMWR